MLWCQHNAWSNPAMSRLSCVVGKTELSENTLLTLSFGSGFGGKSKFYINRVPRVFICRASLSILPAFLSLSACARASCCTLIECAKPYDK